VRPFTILIICDNFLPSIVIVWSFLSQCLCRSTEHSHVKTNMVHTLHRVKAMGSMPLESSKDLFIEEEFRKCANNLHLKKAWFKLTSEVFILYFFWVIFILQHSFHSFLPYIFPSLKGSSHAFSYASTLMLVPLCSLAVRDCRGLR
jgi:hypothetical protein